MPSFFFHLAIDLDLAGNSAQRVTEEPSSNNKTSTNHKPTHFPTYQKISCTSPSGTSGPETGPAVSSIISHDWRYDKISTTTVTMAPSAVIEKKDSNRKQSGENITNGISAGPGGLATKGRYEPCDPKEEDLGWGVVRLYRDAEETPALYDEPTSPKHSKHARASSRKEEESRPRSQDEECTTLCILAVPSYLTPSDFLGFVGEKTREEVSHFRMIRTERGNRYMVLMKFRNGKQAREWRRQWNGKAFDGMEPENCHVVFVKSIEFRTHSLPGQEASFPDMTNDPFTPSTTTPQATATRPSKPQPPPTPSLIELPTCPVCLERMDESTGLLTILCQHVFHCSCLQKWRGSGCPVCRYTQDDLAKNRYLHPAHPTSEPEMNECSICRSDANLWICLICGNVGCGRYDAAHAFAHYEASAHSFAMDMSTQRIWDYSSDGYVHRIVQDKTDGKFVDTHHTTNNNASTTSANHGNHNGYRERDDDFDDYVPREKLENINREYTSLLSSQLDSQRTYFEEILERAADKASRAAASAERALDTSARTQAQLAELRSSHDVVVNDTIPALERDKDRETRKSAKYADMARKLEKEWRDEKAMTSSLLERVERLAEDVKRLEREKAELAEENRDLGFFISGGEKLKALQEGDGAGDGGGGVNGLGAEEVREGLISLPVAKEGGEGKKGGRKGKGKK